MMRVNGEVLARLVAAAWPALEGTPVAVAYLFGSQARGTARPDSDIDVAVLLDESMPPARQCDVALDAARGLAVESGLGGIEVVVLNSAPLPLRGRILVDRQIVFCRDEARRVDYETRTWSEFFDFQLSMRDLDRKLLEEIAAGRR